MKRSSKEVDKLRKIGSFLPFYYTIRKVYKMSKWKTYIYTQVKKVRAIKWDRHEEDLKDLVRPHPIQYGTCSRCRQEMANHGVIERLDRDYKVCPGYYIVIDFAGNIFVVDPESFKRRSQQLKRESLRWNNYA